MLLKLLGAIDVIVAILLSLAEAGMPINRFYIIFVLMHAVKAIYFLKNFLSIGDLLVTLYTIIFPFWSHPILTIAAVVFLLAKGLYSQI